MSEINLDGMIIDDETGEVLAFAHKVPGPRQRFNMILNQARRADRQEKRWKQISGALRQALLRELDADGVKAADDGETKAQVVETTRRTASAKNLLALAVRFELDDDQVKAVLGTATALDVRRIDGLVEDGTIPAEVARQLMATSQSRYVRLDTIAEEAP